jgi:hypothetical protein
MKTFIKLAVFLFVSLALQYCGPSDSEAMYSYIPQETKDWSAYKIGTWWVYEEETSKLRDSIYVYQYIDSFYVRRNWTNQYQQGISMYTASSLGIDSFHHGVFSDVIMRRINVEIPELTPQCYLLIRHPIKQGSWTQTGPTSQHTIFDTIYPNLQIGDFNFTNVVRANNNMNLAYNYTPTLIYSAKHIGIVRKEFPEYKQVWNLVRYNIVQ